MLNKNDYENSTSLPTNVDYWQEGLEGMQNLSRRAGFPLFLTKPHFFDADPVLLDGVIGLKPQAELHDTHVHVEPYTGMTLRAWKRMQLSMWIEDWDLPSLDEKLVAKLLSLFPKLKHLAGVVECISTPTKWTLPKEGLYVPVLWLEESFEVPESVTDDIKEQVYKPVDMSDKAIDVLFILGLSLCTFAFLLMFFDMVCTTSRKKDDYQHIPTTEAV